MATVTTSHTWRSTTLGEFFRIKHGYAFKGEYFSESGPYVLLTPGNFCPDGGIKLKGEKEKYYVGPFPDEFLLQRDDLLVVMTDLTQTAAILGSPAFIPHSNRFLHNQRLGKMYDISPDIAKRFLYHLLNTEAVRGQIKGSATGATVRHTAPDRIYAVKVTIPPLPTQRKIATILSAYDDLIENNLRRIKILEEMAQNLYREWFVKFRFPGHQHAHFTDSPLGRIPEGWEVANLLDIAVVKYGKNLPTKNLAPDGDYPVYGAAKIIGRYTECTREERTIITGCRGSVGEMQITLPKCFVTNNSFTFDVQQHIDFFWLFHSLKERGFADVIGGAAQPQITLDGLSKVQILVPLKATRSLFHEHIADMFSLLWNLEGRNTTLRRTRDLLLPRLISGEVDVSELDITVPEATC